MRRQIGIFSNFNYNLCVERTFGIFKDKRKLIMKRSKVLLIIMSIVVATCIVLYLLSKSSEYP